MPHREGARGCSRPSVISGHELFDQSANLAQSKQPDSKKGSQMKSTSVDEKDGRRADEIQEGVGSGVRWMGKVRWWFGEATVVLEVRRLVGGRVQWV